MAITRAQQAKQMLQNGGMLVQPGFGGTRQGYRGPGGYQGRTPSTKASNPNQRTGASEDGVERDTGLERERQRNIAKIEKFKATRPEVKKIPPMGPIGIATNLFNKQLQKFSDFTTAKNRAQFERAIRAGKIEGLNFGTLDDLTEDELENAYQDYMDARMANEIDAFGNPLSSGEEGRGGQPIIPQTMVASAPAVDDYYGPGGNPFLNRTAFRLLADGGRIGFQVGGQTPGPKGQRGGSTIGPGGPGSGGGGNGNKNISGGGGGSSGGQGPVAIKAPVNIVEPKSNIEKFLDIFRSEDDDEKSLKESLASGIKNQPEFQQKIDDTVSGIMANPDLAALGTIIQSKAEGGRIGLMEGGMPYEGGIMDLESARQMFFLGKLVKKATRAVKKIAKSPIGKAALLYAGTAGLGSLAAGGGMGSLFKLGTYAPSSFAANVPAIFSKAGLKNILVGGKGASLGGNRGMGAGIIPEFSGIFGSGGKMSAIKAIGVPTLLSYLMTPKPKDEDEDETLDRGERLDIPGLRARGMRFDPDLIPTRFAGSQFQFAADGGRIGYQEGSKEPVAKKTMPLLDMGGKEMDLREEGGFVPIGRMEKADDVPARLSKNEFVFTADAVRNAGDGNVDKGAEVMYNMMKNLEAGGDVSEESQGLKGARRMFETSQRLEEVL